MFDYIYKEVKNHTTGIYKEKGSKFIAYSYPIYSEQEVKERLEEVKKLEDSARHHCYAYVLATIALAKTGKAAILMCP